MEDLERASRGETETDEPEELVIRAFSRCGNYPKERAGVLGLAQGLLKASEKFHVPMQRIIQECIESSTFCPTDHDLLEVARALKKVPDKPKETKCSFGLCDGSGWRESFMLHTVHPGDETHSSWIEKEPIANRETYDKLAKSVDWKTQMAYEGRYRCKCHPPRAEDEKHETRKRNKARA